MHAFLTGTVASMPRKYDKETRAKAIRLVRDHGEGYESEYEAMSVVAGRLGMNPGTVRRWLRQVEVDAGEAEGSRHRRCVRSVS